MEAHLERKNVTVQQESGPLDIRLNRQGRRYHYQPARCRSYYGPAIRDADLRVTVERLRNNSRGFTIVEMMVALFIVALIFSIVIGFYLFQSKRGGQSAKELSTRHSVELALMQIQRDVIQMGYGVSAYPQMAYYFDTENTTYPEANKPYYDTLYVNYGQFLKSTVPTTGDIVGVGQNLTKPFAMWPALVYNLYTATPITSSNIISQKFSIPAPSQAEAQANQYNIGGVIYLTNPTTPLTARPSAQRVTTPTATPTTVGQTMANPPSGWVTQFTLTGSPIACSTCPRRELLFHSGCGLQLPTSANRFYRRKDFSTRADSEKRAKRAKRPVIPWGHKRKYYRNSSRFVLQRSRFSSQGPVYTNEHIDPSIVPKMGSHR